MRDLFIRILVLTAVAGLMPVWAAGGSGYAPDAVPEKAMTAEAVPGGGAGPLAGGAAGFMENRGQLGAGGVVYYSPGGNVWFTSGGAWFRVEDDGDEMAGREDIQDRAEGEDWGQPVAPASGGSDQVAQPVAVAIRQEFIGAGAVEPEGREPLGYPSNFLFGRDPVGWQAGVETYGEVWYRDIYDGVDLRYHYGPEGLKYDLIVRPGADPGAIRVRYAGAEGLGIDDAGDLRIMTAAGSFSDGGLLVYQDVSGERRTVPCSFVDHGGAEYGFSIEGAYDPGETLVIDPALDFCTYLGGAGFERVRNLHVDEDGDIYLTGNTDSPTFPTTTGVIDTTLDGVRDAYVVKLAPDGSSPVFSTYIGGSQDDRGYDLDLDAGGNLYVTGYTNSASDFPVTTGAYDTGFNGGDADVFLLKLDPTASSVLYGTFIGGSLMDTSRKVLVDPAGGAYLTGETQSADFPTTVGAYDDTHNGSKDAFALRLTPDGSALSWSTYMGGSGLDVGFDISVGTLGEVTVMGQTTSPDLPTTAGAYDQTHNGGSDMMLFRLDATGSSLIFSTFIGGSGSMDPGRMALDGNGDILAVGATTSTDFPTTPGADKQSALGGWDGVVVRLSPDGARLKASTYVGTSEDDEAFDIDIDDDGQVLISGTTNSSGFRTSPGAADGTHNGGLDAFVAILPPQLSYLKYSTFFGGSGDELKTMAAWSGQGDVIIAGDTHSTDLPATPAAFDTGYNGDRDIYIASFSPSYSSGLWVDPVELYLDDNELGENSFTDDFGDAVTSGQIWSPASGDWEFKDGLYRQKAGGWDAMSVIDREVANGVVGVDVTVHQTNPQDSGILFRYQDVSNCYVFQLHPGDDLAKVFRRVSDVWEPLRGGYWQVDPGVTYALKVDLQGERIRCFVNDTLVIDITDDTYSTGAVGLKANSVTEFDDLHTRSFGTADVYSQYDTYTFRVRAHAPASHDDIDDVRLIMDPDGLNVRLGWDRGAGVLTEISDPDDIVTLGGTSSATAGPSGLWILDFDVPFPWEFPTEGALDVRVEARGGGWQDAWSERTDLLRVETDLTFTGGLQVHGFDERAVEDGGMVLAGEELGWGGLTVVYEGTTDIFPPDDSHDVLIDDSEGGSWESSPAPGEPIDMLTQVPTVGDGTTVTYRLSITGVPPASDASDVSYDVTVRDSALLFNEPVPDDDEWLTSGSAVVGITITSAGYGDVDGGSVGFSTSTDGGDGWSEWQAVPYPSAASIVALGAVELPDGTDNLVMWRAAHSLDPEWVQSPGFPVLVDSEDATFSEPRPGEDDVAETTTVEVGVTIMDEVSGVDGATVEYAVSTDGGESWGPWNPVGGAGSGGEVAVATDVVLTRGDDNFIRWRCSDAAGNGPAVSGEYNVRVSPDAGEYGPQTILEGPVDNATVEPGELVLSWGLMNDTWDEVHFDIYLDTTDPPHNLYASEIHSYELKVKDLVGDTRFYWTVVPHAGDIIGTCASGVWSFITGPEPVEYGVILSDPGNITVAQGTLETVQLLLTNTGTATDTFELTAASETLGKAVSMETESEEVAAGPLAQKLLKLTLDLPQNASLGPHKVTVTAVSMGADDAGMDVGFNVTFNVVVVEGAGGGENGGDDGGEGAGGGGEEELSQTTVALVAGLTVAAVLIALSPWLHVWTLFAMAPLMVRYRNGETDRKWKDRIYSSITSNPGVHFTRLKEWLTISNGTLTYNLEILIQEKRIRAVRDGLFKKYYPVETALDRLPVDSLSLEDKIILSVRDNPGAAQSEMAHNLDESRQNVHYHVKKLVGLGILEPEANRDGHPRYRLARTRAARRKLQDIFDRRVELPYGDEAVDTN